MSLAHCICVTGTGKYRSFQDGYHRICSAVHQEKYQYLFLCAKASHDIEPIKKLAGKFCAFFQTCSFIAG